MSWILVTNDDGIDARALAPLARALGALAPVRVVVPDGERSWVGKAITRAAPITVTPAERDGVEMLACSGFPADCVQLGVNTLFDGPPLLVVSGINLGYNHGSAYLQSSGTLGAAMEACLAGVDGLAVSAGVESDFAAWRDWALTDDSIPMWERLAAIAADLTAAMLEAGPIGVTINANLPHEADRDTERRLTTVARTGYDRLFREESPGTYVHDYRGGLHHRAAVEGTDVDAAADGVVSITPVKAISEITLPDRLGGLLRRRTS
jgi:5'-nucleotidase